MRQLRMKRDTLEALPNVTLPPGALLRLAVSEDAGGLSSILAASFPDFPWTPDKVRGELLEHPEVFATFLIETSGRPAAAASCMRIADDSRMGYLHWCGVHPAAQGARLGRMVCIAVLEEFLRTGMTSAILDTDDHRIPAVKTYLKLGFCPLIRDEDDELRWKAVLESVQS